jgi:hypothetical protein
MLLVPVQAERAQQALHVEAGRFFRGLCNSGGCVVFDSGSGAFAGETEEGFDALAGKAETSGEVQV